MQDANQTITFCGVGSHHQNAIVERKIQTLTIGDSTFIIHADTYWIDVVTTILCPYEPKAFAEQLNVLKVDGDGITLMENVSGTTTYITIKNHHTWGCPFYVLD